MQALRLLHLPLADDLGRDRVVEFDHPLFVADGGQRRLVGEVRPQRRDRHVAALQAHTSVPAAGSRSWLTDIQ